MSLTNLITENINDEYCMIRYADFDIIMCRKDQYLNMTKVVALDKTSGGEPKELRRWFKSSPAEEIIAAVNEEVGTPDSPPIYYKIETGPNNLRGTYCHQLLVPHILSWCSAKFAVKISRIVNSYFSLLGDMKLTEERMKHNELMKELRDQHQQNLEIEKKRVARHIEKRKQLAIQHNELVDRFNKQEELHAQTLASFQLAREEDRQTFLKARAEDRARHEALLAAFDGVTIKNAKILEALSNLRKSLSSAPIIKLDPSARTFDVINNLINEFFVKENQDKMFTLERMNVQEPYFSLIRDGSKTVEGRLYDGKFMALYKRLSPNTSVRLTISCSGKAGQEFDVAIIGAKRYKTFADMIIGEGLRNVLPNVDTLEEGVAVYRRFYTEEREAANGVVAFYLRVH